MGHRSPFITRLARRVVVAIAAATAVAAMGNAAMLSAAPPARLAAASPLRVELWGDSLSAQAATSFSFYLGITRRAVSQTHVFGGTAMCDWLTDMRNEINPANRSGFHPQVAVVQFSGNSFTSCMQDRHHVPLSGQALISKYAADSVAVIAMFSKAKIPVYFASSPISRPYASQYVDDTPLGVMYSKLPAAYPAQGLVRFIDAAQAVEWHGHYTDTLPVAVWEKPTGRWADGTKTVVVRQADGTHFCPVPEPAVKGVVPTCPVYSGGAARFALAMTGRIVGDYHLG
jgi:hypothetical protein